MSSQQEYIQGQRSSPGTQSIDCSNETETAISQRTNNTASVSQPPSIRVLPYPRNFFHPTKGTVHDNVLIYHAWRKARPNQGEIDTETPDPEALKREAEAIRVNLRRFTKKTYYGAVAELIKGRDDFTMTGVNGTSVKPVNEADFRETLATLTQTPQNEEMVFTIFHHQFRPRSFTAETVDRFMEKNHMTLLPHPFEENTDENGKRRRYSGRDRGGFGVAAQQAKSQAIDSLMKSMLAKAGWCIASVFKNCKTLQYEERFLTIEKETIRYQVVTKKVRHVLFYYCFVAPFLSTDG